ncbi:hypothetical protein LIER_42804 [Lithospermum erythrorhizon]|uniref:Polyprotein n=1 Tax=Lithospermum erythrorhizon TaxID=34254 RepID=A0AAV3NYK4_LITER
MFLTQQKYIRDILLDLKMKEEHVVATPLPHDWHRRLVGRLLYLNFTRHEHTFSVHSLSQFLQSPTDAHWRASLHVVKYLKGTLSHALFYGIQEGDLTIDDYCDICIPSKDQLSDIFTKALPAPAVQPLLSKMSFVADPS